VKATHPAAFDTCRCGHNRIGHLSHGRGACSRTTYRTQAVQGGGVRNTIAPCDCARFTEKGQNNGSTATL